MVKVTKVMMKYARMGLFCRVLSDTKAEVLGMLALRLIQFNPSRNKMAKSDRNSMLMSLFIDSS